MNKKPEVSVVVPAYNVEEYIGQCLKSILKQTFENIEILCIDDGSRDRTVDIIREYMAKDGRIDPETQRTHRFSSRYIRRFPML